MCYCCSCSSDHETDSDCDPAIACSSTSVKSHDNSVACTSSQCTSQCCKDRESLFSLELHILRRGKANKTGHLIMGGTGTISGSPFVHLKEKFFVFIVTKLHVKVCFPQVPELIAH